MKSWVVSFAKLRRVVLTDQRYGLCRPRMTLFCSPQPYRNILVLATTLVRVDARRSNDVVDLELLVAPLTLRYEWRVLFVSSLLRLQAVSTCATSGLPAILTANGCTRLQSNPDYRV